MEIIDDEEEILILNEISGGGVGDIAGGLNPLNNIKEN